MLSNLREKMNPLFFFLGISPLDLLQVDSYIFNYSRFLFP